MIERSLLEPLRQALAESPAVCLLGPRQVGKTTLALDLAEPLGGLYLDLESEQDLAKLQEPEAYLSMHMDHLVILDEVHRLPGLFPVLRGLIDRARRSDRRVGLYLLLGSASLDLLRQSGESLAGRLRFLEMSPLSVIEPTGASTERLWLRGGFLCRMRGRRGVSPFCGVSRRRTFSRSIRLTHSCLNRNKADFLLR